MKNTKKIVKHVAALAHLDLNPEKEDLYEKQLGTIIAHFEELTQLSLDDVPETSRVNDEINIWRHDTVLPSFSQQEALRNAKTHNGYFVVPFVLTGKDES